MYKIERKEDTIRIPPDRLSDDIDKAIEELTHANLEGKIVGGEYIVLATNIKKFGEGRIVHGDGAVYQNVIFDALIFKPELQEVVCGTVCEILKFGAFVRFGPLDGLLHISQIMDDRIEIDETGNRLVGKDTKKDLKVGDMVKARIVAISINERNPRESKIGLTMRQQGLGKKEWLQAKIEEKKVVGKKK
ncbi:MAG: DNA-directed RNA polymerase [Candidatus Thermoplasmatota archaeon]